MISALPHVAPLPTLTEPRLDILMFQEKGLKIYGCPSLPALIMTWELGIPLGLVT